MRLILAFGAALAATTMMAYAQTEERSTERTHVFVRHGGHAEMDADNDGWISRAESAGAAERMFGEFDRNDDGRLDRTDHAGMLEEFDVRIAGPRHAPEADDDTCERTESGEGEDRRVTIICRSERGEDGEVRRHVLRRGEGERDVIIRRDGDGDGHVMIAPMPPHPPHPPMFMFAFGEDSEADLNNDGAISQDEFRTQHLRMFDAQDANGDGRVRAHRMPVPPAPPAPPTPPSPPRRG
ncbi:MAG TPA: hypothetical protein VEF55_01830 [Candidatus Binatia bacterium]|nr:hypothetical protein [Candidatus Binatia bacterium]